jgi:hypothetical protein
MPDHSPRRHRRRLAAAIVLAALATVALAQAPDTAETVAQAAREAQDIRRDTQRRQDDWAAEQAALLDRLETARRQVTYLEDRVALERDRAEALEASADELARRLDESVRLEASLEDTLLAILRRLDHAVAADLPFLPDERANRLRTVRAELGDPAADAAEKLRRVLEAVLIEARYGGAVELDQGRIDVAGEELTCDLLHVGRLALFWLTPDRARGGAWDPVSCAYVEHDGDALDAVRRAADMATRRRTPGVLALPVGRVAP